MDQMTPIQGRSTTVVTSVAPLMQQFLTWVAIQPRTYGATMEAWRSHCPRFTIWEDALADELVQVTSSGTTLDSAQVSLTERGLMLLEGG